MQGLVGQLLGVVDAVAKGLFDEHGDARVQVRSRRLYVQPRWIADDGEIESGADGLGIAGNNPRGSRRLEGRISADV